jgi:hypothetical protein
MEKILTYIDEFKKAIGIYSIQFIEENGVIFFIVILLVTILTFLFILQKIRIKQVQKDFYENKIIED